MQRLIRRRRETPEMGMGEWSVIDVGPSEVFAVEFRWGDRCVIVATNLSSHEVEISVANRIEDTKDGRELVDIWSDDGGADLSDGICTLGPYGYRWMRLRRPDDGLLL
jgi:maltose alpha-D-glucosyltransferase/alpha-amylase